MTENKMKLLVDSDEFWLSLKNDIDQAQKSVYIQTLSFEGDKVGLALCEAMDASSAGDRRIIVDQYTRYIISDRFIYTPSNYFDKTLRDEVRSTRKMISDSRAAGTQIKWVNPAGLLLRKFVARNHKKMVVIDNNITYIGGINFSEHNFAWHDMMLRIESEEIAAFFSNDFLGNWSSKADPITSKFGELDFIMFNGHTNEKLFEKIIKLLDAAKKSIVIESPYLTFPFFEILGAARRRGVEVTIITPAENNKKSIQDYIIYEADRLDLKVKLYKDRMTHLKAILIDNETLIMGSTNFDYLSYKVQQEIAAIITDRSIIESFKKRVIEPDLANSIDPSPDFDRNKSAALARRMQRVASFAVKLSRL